MAEVKAYACDICGLLTRHSYDHFDFDKQMYGKKYKGFVTLTFEDNSEWDVCMRCAKSLIIEGGPFNT